MEVFSNTLLTKPQLSSSTVSFLSPTPSLTTLTKKSRYKFSKTHLKSSPNPSFSTSLPLINSKNPQIIARFGRPTKRRNSLRKKLTGNGSQVRPNPPNNVDPIHHFADNDAFESNLVNANSLEKGSEKVGNLENDSKRFGDPALWNKLESWVELYKKDIEFWGIGSNPIFTVFQDSSGNVEKVVVDEDEILKRSGVDPLYFREEGDLEDFGDVKSKISHTKFLARELESGKDAIAKNSSVVKFVVSGENSGFVSRIRSISVPQNLIPKVSRVGIAVVCGFLVVWVTKKLFALGGKGVEVTSFEKEMLRRKIKARMEKEKLQKGSVEVVEEPTEPSTVITERPQLDKEEVLSSIRNARGLSSTLATTEVGGARETGSEEMDFKIKEIQMLARRAREIERGECSASEKGKFDREILGELPMEINKSEEAVKSIQGNELEKQDLNVLPSLERDDAEIHVEGLMNPSEDSTETVVINGILKTEIIDHHERESDQTELISEGGSEGIEDVELRNVSSGRITDDQNSHINNLNHSHDSYNSSDSAEGIWSSDVFSSQLSQAKKNPVRRMPKIIRSVQEARDYLSQKHDHKPDISDNSATAASLNDGMDHYSSQGLREDDKAPESSNIDGMLDPVPVTEISEDHAVKEDDYFATDINGLNKETRIGLMRNSVPDPESAEGSRIDAKLNIGNSRITDEESNHSNSCERSDSVPGDNVFHDACLEVDDKSLSEESLVNINKLDEMPKPTYLSEIFDLVPDRIASHNSCNTSEASDIHSQNALLDANLEEKAHLPSERGLAEVDGLNETKPTDTSEISALPVAASDNIDDSASEETAFLPIEMNDDKDFRKNHEENILIAKESWLEKNFHEVEPIVNKISSGIKNSYMVAREKVKQDPGTGLDFMNLRSIKDNAELEWMQDDELREIVFKVRDNELAGRDPFHSMDVKDKAAFFKGLEAKVEKENEKLSVLHEWLHSNIENVDYGADGISIYDPPEKFIPRWKGPPIDDIPEFLTNTEEQQEVTSLQKANESPQNDNTEISQEASIKKSRPGGKVAKVSKTVIEASDGSVKPGKKSGKEYWQHTKKWSRGFVESYNAETDPEVKSTMKDIGKDLDRWITEKEIQDAADLMDKVPQRGKKLIEKKLNKLKREMELFGPQAVVSKYREYAEEKEEDYLWWLDLPHVLCIELYTYEGEDQKVGFYTLEMAPDLELEPKPQHVIAFQDPGDCKNFCYIVQAHLEMLGKGKAFIVPQPPKDVFLQAKENGFGVTVIRKGEVQLNVDQPLEEVEELITEIGSKMYHDKIMRERSVDINSLMKGVFGFNPSIKRKRKKRARKRPSKPK